MLASVDSRVAQPHAEGALAVEAFDPDDTVDNRLAAADFAQLPVGFGLHKLVDDAAAADAFEKICPALDQSIGVNVDQGIIEHPGQLLCVAGRLGRKTGIFSSQQGGLRLQRP